MILKGHDDTGTKITTRREKAAVKLVFENVNGFKTPSIAESSRIRLLEKGYSIPEKEECKQ
jgi:hypothetical protein